MSLSVAIVGSGPAGLAVAERIAHKAPQARIDLIEKLPVPFGLARYGLAPDRALDKKLTTLFTRALAAKPVAFWGNVALGREFDLADLRMLYDAVVVATGAGPDRRLGIPGDGLSGVWGAGAFLRWVNGDPELASAPPALDRVRSVIVVGQGSVALEVARLLARSAKELTKADLDPDIAATLAVMPLQTVHVVGRNDLLASRFQPADLAELKKLARAQAAIDPEALAQAEALADGLDRDRKALLRAFAALAAVPRNEARLSIRFHFHLRPLRLDGTVGVERMLFTRPDRLGQNLALRGELVIAAIGFERCADYDRLVDDRGLIAPGLYAAGWAKRGAAGGMAEIVADARLVADRVLKEAGTAPSTKPGRVGLARLLETRGAGAVSLAGWQRIDAAEKAAAVKPRPRRRLRALQTLLTTAAGPERLL
ncbi:MAG: FAD-dependent oxidoreductase [Alphaproteobacteria bacterium]|nr:FAD-dependent oxidoreductase [Alphaproteobacteria bacterium]